MVWALAHREPHDTPKREQSARRAKTKPPSLTGRAASTLSAEPTARATPRLARACARCGGELPHQRRVYCPPCEQIFRQEQRAQTLERSAPIGVVKNRRGKDTAHGGTAAQKRAATNTARKDAIREWGERHGKLVDLSAFEREVLPLIQSVPLSRLQRATGLSLRYVSQIRRGEKTPHPQHWASLVVAGGAR